MKYIYTAVFKEEGKKVHARVPDLPGCITTGRSLDDAIRQITDAAHGWLVVAEDEGLDIPSASSQSELADRSATAYSLLCLDTIQYRAATDTHAVRKNVSLPAWMAAMAEKRGINCSQVLQDSLRTLFESE